jgi:hypothetical protein
MICRKSLPMSAVAVRGERSKSKKLPSPKFEVTSLIIDGNVTAVPRYTEFKGREGISAMWINSTEACRKRSIKVGPR